MQATFEGEALGGMFDQLKDAMAEHSSWLSMNCQAQQTYYTTFVEKRKAGDAMQASGAPRQCRVTTECVVFTVSACFQAFDVSFLCNDFTLLFDKVKPC